MLMICIQSASIEVVHAKTSQTKIGRRGKTPTGNKITIVGMIDISATQIVGGDDTGLGIGDHPPTK